MVGWGGGGEGTGEEGGLFAKFIISIQRLNTNLVLHMLGINSSKQHF